MCSDHIQLEKPTSWRFPDDCVKDVWIASITWVPKKAPFSPAKAIAGRCLEVIEPLPLTSDTVEAPPVINAGDILIPRPVKPWFNKRSGKGLLLCVFCTTKKVKCISTTLGTPPKCSRGQSTTRRARSRTPSKAPSTTQPKARMCSQFHGPSSSPSTITAVKAPAPAPAPIASLSSTVPRAALDVPMPDLHAMSMAIQEGAARIAALKACVVEQAGMIDTLQCLHESL
ncbi:hypothetical protein EV702DRAFT_1197438 [Suillus placidus]|uniref:Uncharacterized protein n=1 Tax=Suillus placidus TaxID=48579 RepID=A0A9P6ZVB1_9AGAM|nr:hypothetical protein EV702DRAFT_1197438 [Suillus placidus]